MKYPRILSELIGHQWAILPEALKGILAGIENGLSPEDYKLFHAVSQDDMFALTAEAGEQPEGTRFTRISGDTAFLFVNGPIIPRSSAITDISGLTSISQLTTEWLALEADEEIVNIIGVFDTPGGAVAGVSDFAGLIAASGKNTVAYVFGNAASAGFWIASAFDHIVSSDTGLVGSVGVVMSVNIREDDQTVEIVSNQSPFKRDSLKSKAGKERAQTIVDDLADVFVSTVATGRGVSKKTVLSKFGKGGMLVAARAQKAGMIDAISTMQGTIAQLKNNEDMRSDTGSDNANMSAGAGESITMEVKKMNLQEAIAESPRIASEVDKIKEEAYAEGAKVAATAAAADATAATERTRLSAEILVSEVYPKAIKEMAAKVLNGKVSADSLQGAVTVYDAMKEDENGESAEGEQSPPTPTQGDDQPLSEDGSVSTEADVQATIARLSGEA